MASTQHPINYFRNRSGKQKAIILFHEQINTIELELSSKCNARCPQCPRNYYGGSKWPSLPDNELSLSWIKEKIPSEVLQNVDEVKLCGTYGEPVFNTDILEIIQYLKTFDITIVLNTNGGVRNANFWQRLGRILNNKDKVYFAIDGLHDTHHLHRINVNLNTVVKNIQNYIAAGGNAAVTMCIFEHNQHQVSEVENLCTTLGVKDFSVKSTSRFITKDYKKTDYLDVLDITGEYSHTIRPTTLEQYVNEGYDNFKTFTYKKGCIDCTSKRNGWVSVGADGYVMPCGFLLDRFYGYEAEKSFDRQKLFDLMNLSGGSEKANLNHTNFTDIVFSETGWFSILESSWQDGDRALQRCYTLCNKDNNIMLETNKFLKDTWSGVSPF